MQRSVQTERGRGIGPCRAALPCSTSPAVVPAAAATAAAAAVTEAGAVVCLLPTNTHRSVYVHTHRHTHTHPHTITNKMRGRNKEREREEERGQSEREPFISLWEKKLSVIRTRQTIFFFFERQVACNKMIPTQTRAILSFQPTYNKDKTLTQRESSLLS